MLSLSEKKVIFVVNLESIKNILAYNYKDKHSVSYSSILQGLV